MSELIDKAKELLERDYKVMAKLCIAAEAENDQLTAQLKAAEEVINAAMQRLNESATGEIGLADTIHETHAILAAHKEQK